MKYTKEQYQQAGIVGITDIDFQLHCTKCNAYIIGYYRTSRPLSLTLTYVIVCVHCNPSKHIKRIKLLPVVDNILNGMYELYMEQAEQQIHEIVLEKNIEITK